MLYSHLPNYISLIYQQMKFLQMLTVLSDQQKLPLTANGMTYLYNLQCKFEVAEAIRKLVAGGAVQPSIVFVIGERKE
jgi:hypothetical protein